MMKKINLYFVVLILSLLTPAVTNAHDMWFEMKNFNIQKGSFLECTYPSDHAFPSTNNEFVPIERLAKSYLISPSGAYIPLVAAKNNINRSAQKLNLPGTYLGVSGKNWTYWTQTPEGFQEGKSKLQVKNALKGVYSAKFCKAIITVEKSGGNAFSRIVGHELEIVPFKDPSVLVTGDILPFKVLLQGQPIGIEVKASYENFSSKQNEFAVMIKTDKMGLGNIEIGKKGKWIIIINYMEKVKDNRLYDEKMYAATLTFQIR